MYVHAEALEAVCGMLLALPHLNKEFVDSMKISLRAEMHERIDFEKANPGQELDSPAEATRYLMSRLSKPQIEIIFKL